MEKKQQTFSAWYFLIALLTLFMIQIVLLAPAPKTLSYSDFKTLLKGGKVSDLTVGTRTLSGRLKTEGLEELLPKEKVEKPG